MGLVDNVEVLKNLNISLNFENSEVSGPAVICVREKTKHKNSCHCPLVELKQTHVQKGKSAEAECSNAMDFPVCDMVC